MTASELDSKYPKSKNCFVLEKQIAQIKQDQAHYYSIFWVREAEELEGLLRLRMETYAVLGCPAVIEAKRQADTGAVLDKYSNIAQQRIETESKSTKTVYIAIAAVLLIGAMAIIIKNK